MLYCLQKPSDTSLLDNEEIDWTHFTFQHGFRILPQQSSFTSLPGTVTHTLTDATHPLTDGTLMDSAEAGTPSDPQLLAEAVKQNPAEHAMHAAPDMISGAHQSASHDHTEHARPGSHPASQQHALSGHQLPSQQHHQSAAVATDQHELANGTDTAQQAHARDSGSDRAVHAAPDSNEAQHAQHAQLREAEEEPGGVHGPDAEGEGEGEGEAEGGSDEEEGAEAKRITRSRKSNAAELYMLDHGSQLVPRKVLYNLPPTCSNPNNTLHALFALSVASLLKSQACNLGRPPDLCELDCLNALQIRAPCELKREASQ